MAYNLDSGTVESEWTSAIPNIDAMVLEQALRERSAGSMVAPLRDVVRLAVERWGYPGSVGSAEAILLQSGRYEVEADPEAAVTMVRPRRSEPLLAR